MSQDGAKKPKHLKTKVIASATEANREGVKALESERTKLTKELSKLEKNSLTFVDRLADPALQAITVITDRLAALEKDQQSLKSRITELTLQIRDRRDGDISTEEVQAAYEDFAGLWKELDFDERQYALRLLIKQIQLKFKKKDPSGEIEIEAWGQRPLPHWSVPLGVPLPGHATKSCVTRMEGSPNPTVSGKSLGLPNVLNQLRARNYTKSVRFGQCLFRSRRSANFSRSG